MVPRAGAGGLQHLVVLGKLKPVLLRDLLPVEEAAFGHGQDADGRALQVLDLGELLLRDDEVARLRRERDKVREAFLLKFDEARQQVLLRHQIDLVQHEDSRGLRLRNQIEQESVAAAAGFARIDHDGNHVDLAEGVDRGIDHPHVQSV